ncbi:hypothetical protein MAHJHV55_54490 [Mycobacterium avium subsp. hominissuis]
MHHRPAPAHVVEFFATTDGQAVLANVSGAKVGSTACPSVVAKNSTTWAGANARPRAPTARSACRSR